MTTDELLNTLQGDEYTEKVRFEAKRLKDKLDFCIKHDTPTGNLFERINKLKEYVKPHPILQANLQGHAHNENR